MPGREPCRGFGPLLCRLRFSQQHQGLTALAPFTHVVYKLGRKAALPKCRCHIPRRRENRNTHLPPTQHNWDHEAAWALIEEG